MLSEMSHGSIHGAEIGRAIPVHVFGGKDARVHRGNIDDDDLSLVSLSQVQLGRLNTIRSVGGPGLEPELTVSTAVDSVIPPRLKRRPVSEFIPARSIDTASSTSSHHHRHSLNLNEDLDRLMESANHLQLVEELSRLKEVTPVPERPSLMSPPHTSGGSGHSRLDSVVSGETFATAGEGHSVTSFQEPEALFSVPMPLPKRPNADNLERARQASRQYSGRESISLQPTVNQEIEDTVGEQSTFAAEADLGTVLPEGGREAVGAGLASGALGISGISAISGGSGGSAPKAQLPSDPDLRRSGDSNGSDEPLLRSKLDITPPIEALSTKGTPDTPQGSPKGSPKDRQVQQQDLSEVHTPQRSNTNKELPAPPTLLARSEGIPSNVRDSVYTQDSKADDSNFYDIEEPVIVSKPVRSKSVKDSITGPKRRSTKKRNSRRTKSRDASNLQLKPFSYNTLIHLLESVNGTVVGEEFESLNLPVKEKQMIEKIVDSLSRLTLDMVIDENRYEIGMQRLEKAHRVLEGFL